MSSGEPGAEGFVHMSGFYFLGFIPFLAEVLCCTHTHDKRRIRASQCLYRIAEPWAKSKQVSQALERGCTLYL